jgi:hypothetical protein
MAKDRQKIGNGPVSFSLSFVTGAVRQTWAQAHRPSKFANSRQ